ncbi:yolk-protein-like protein [Daphnia pulex]|uniref:Yolk-protein-like protein n=1 Tax=Daphnia pulex TaxID=6669 RepID=E9GNA4_DAPPU|nr:yolk-protein-like protein [Daphnia pulex]|eukprot:EFX79066.1 yolk-protein-like protein [Daphnia pulex]
MPNLSNPNFGLQLPINQPDVLNWSTFNRLRPVKVLIHGFGGNGTTDRFVSKARDAYLLLGDFNVITVDWRSLAEYPNYARAALSTTPVGIYVAKFLDFLISQGTSSSLLHVIGYSLGAHVAGSVGNCLRLGRLPRITGLEPASGGYERIEKLRSLSSSDADFVDVIHTNAHVLGLGTTTPIGHADFYPNGGHWQYGCLWNTEYDSLIHCSHGRSTHYFIESILAGPTKFLSSRCPSYLKFNLGICGGCQDPLDRHNCVSMGEFANPTASGTYYLYTNPTSPYSIE